MKIVLVKEMGTQMCHLERDKL